MNICGDVIYLQPIFSYIHMSLLCILSIFYFAFNNNKSWEITSFSISGLSLRIGELLPALLQMEQKLLLNEHPHEWKMEIKMPICRRVGKQRLHTRFKQSPPPPFGKSSHRKWLSKRSMYGDLTKSVIADDNVYYWRQICFAGSQSNNN